MNTITIDGQEAIELRAGESSVKIIKSLGGTVYQLTLEGQEILFGDPENEVTKNELFRGRLLFPFNDRIPEGKYKFHGGEYQFPLNCDGKDSIHGLIYNRNMTLLSLEESSLTLKAEIKKDEFPGYPFDINLTVNYKLTETEFTMDFIVENPGNSDSPYAFGWHPYFTFGKNVNSAKLTFGSDEYYDVNEDLYYEGNHYSVSGSDLDFTKGQVLGERELDIAISLSDKSEFFLEDGDKTIYCSFTKSMFPALQLFIPDDRLSVAVEPISAPSDTFNYPDTGLKVLKAGESEKGCVSIKLRQ